MEKEVVDILREKIDKKEWIFLEIPRIKPRKVKGKVFWIGIGGSSSGPKAILKFMEYENFIFLEDDIPYQPNPGDTLYIVSKSGDTYEVNAILKNIKIPKNVIVLTSYENSPLGKFAMRIGAEIIKIPENLSGRFSTFFILLPILDIKKHLRMCIDEIKSGRLDENFFRILDFLVSSYKDGKDLLLIFYSQKIFSLSEHILQIISESLGKGGRAFLPHTFLGPQFQHHSAQAILENPEKFRCIFFTKKPEKKIEKYFLKEAKIVMKIFSEKMPIINIHISGLMDLIKTILYFQVAVATAGEILKINPFDQPNVKIIRDSLPKIKI